MKRLRAAALFLMTALFCSSINVFAQTTTLSKKDTQGWTDVQLIVPLNKKVEFFFQGTLRVGDNLTMPVDERWGAGFNYKLNKYFTLNELYFHREAKPPNGRQECEDRLSFGATLQKPIGKFTLSDRNWFERRWREPQVDAWRYRNRLRLEHPFKINKTKFMWFVSDEIFYDWSAHDWMRNRAAIGASHAFNKHFTGELYYLIQSDGRSRPGDINVIGTTLRFRM